MAAYAFATCSTAPECFPRTRCSEMRSVGPAQMRRVASWRRSSADPLAAAHKGGGNVSDYRHQRTVGGNGLSPIAVAGRANVPAALVDNPCAPHAP